MADTLLEAVRLRAPQSKREVEELLLALADSDDLRDALARLIDQINSETSELDPTPILTSNTLLIPHIARDWEEDKQTSAESEIARFEDIDTKKKEHILDFSDPHLWSSCTSWACLKIALYFRLSDGETPRFIFPRSLEFINTKLAAMNRPNPLKGGVPDCRPPFESVRLATMRWRIYHRQRVPVPRVLENERVLARDFAKRLGEADEEAIARQVLEGDFREWLTAEFLPALDSRSTQNHRT